MHCRVAHFGVAVCYLLALIPNAQCSPDKPVNFGVNSRNVQQRYTARTSALRMEGGATARPACCLAIKLTPITALDSADEVLAQASGVLSSRGSVSSQRSSFEP